ncbi:MAG: hypothetical protein P9M11_06385 [Candidatus Tenebribacter burtonii]|jgi:hypothetical protein|nr:hypothetical protein [Candidatus Tenebribacter burtonii]
MELSQLLQKQKVNNDLIANPINKIKLKSIEEFKNELINNDFPIAISDFSIKKYQRILNNFVVIDSFIGFDYYLLRRTGELLIKYYAVLYEEALSKELEESITIELTSLIHHFLNIIYNIKEKLKKFLCSDKNSHKIKDMILKESAKDKINKIFEDFYPRIEKYCNSRGFIVHNTYSIKLIKQSRNYNISCFAFTLSKDNFDLEKKNRKQFFIEASEEEVLNTIKIIKELIESALEIITDLSNIDSVKFINKFIKITNEKNDYLKMTF